MADSKDKSSSSATAKAAPPGQFFGTPQTVYPKYSMFGAGDWTGLPMQGAAQYGSGGWSLPPPAPATPTSPTPTPLSRQGLLGILGGLNGSRYLSGVTGDNLGLLQQGWGLFGGNNKFPSLTSTYQHALDRYKWPQ